MKPSKPTNSATNSSPRAPRKIGSPEELRELQRVMASALFRPLTPHWGMQKRWTDGSRMHDVAAEFIKPNDRLSSFERLEIYNRQYWFRVLDCLWDDYPGLRAIVGERKFMKLITAYLARYPYNSYTLRDLGNRLERFLREEPQWAAPREELSIVMARFEWGQAVKKRESDVLRGEASNAVDSAPTARARLSPRSRFSRFFLSRLAERRKSMVAPLESTARYKYTHLPLTRM
jgi:hypothetical protein